MLVPITRGDGEWMEGSGMEYCVCKLMPFARQVLDRPRNYLGLALLKAGFPKEGLHLGE
ncbi:hypothetical protein Nmel_002879 [Mimus melanotis]